MCTELLPYIEYRIIKYPLSIQDGTKNPRCPPRNSVFDLVFYNSKDFVSTKQSFKEVYSSSYTRVRCPSVQVLTCQTQGHTGHLVLHSLSDVTTCVAVPTGLLTSSRGTQGFIAGCTMSYHTSAAFI